MITWHLYKNKDGSFSMYPVSQSLIRGASVAVGTLDAMQAAARLLGGA